MGERRLVGSHVGIQRRQVEATEGCGLDVGQSPAAKGQERAGCVVEAEQPDGRGDLSGLEPLAHPGLGPDDLHLFAHPAVDRRGGDGVGHRPARSLVLFGDRRVVESGPGGDAGIAGQGRAEGQIGLDQVEGMLLAVLVLDVDDGAQRPGELRLPDQGRVGERELTLERAAVGPAKAGAAEPALQVGRLAIHAHRAQVEQALEGLGRNQVGFGEGRGGGERQRQQQAGLDGGGLHHVAVRQALSLFPPLSSPKNIKSSLRGMGLAIR